MKAWVKTLQPLKKRCKTPCNVSLTPSWAIYETALNSFSETRVGSALQLTIFLEAATLHSYEKI